MPRAAGGHRPLGQMVSSGRLSGPPKHKGGKRRSSSLGRRAVSPDSGYSLYSTESEDQVAVIHRGLDRCAALLQDFLLTEPSRPQGAMSQRRPAKSSAGGPSRPRAKRSLSRTRADGVGKAHAEPRRTSAPAIKKETLAAGGSTAFNGRLASSTPTLASPPRAPPPATKPTTPPATPGHSYNSSPRAITSSERAYSAYVPVSTATATVTAATSPVAVTMPATASRGMASSLLPPTSEGGAPWAGGRWADLARADGAHARFMALQPEWEARVTTDASGEEDVPQDRFLEQTAWGHRGPVTALGADGRAERDGLDDDRDDVGSDQAVAGGTQAGGGHGEAARRAGAVTRGLAQLRELLARQDVRACVRLLAELEHSVVLLATALPEPDQQAEAMLPQPTGSPGSPSRTLALMRSENSVLHRRVQTLSQQLRERERPDHGSNTELAHLRAANAALQEQLSRSRAETQAERGRHDQLSRQLGRIWGGPGPDGREGVGGTEARGPESLGTAHWEEEAARVREEVDEALCCLRSVREQLQASRDEAEGLRAALVQREQELHSLRQLSATLQGSMTRLLSELSSDVRPGSCSPPSVAPPLARPTPAPQGPLQHGAPGSARHWERGMGGASHGGGGGGSQGHWDVLGGAAHGAGGNDGTGQGVTVETSRGYGDRGQGHGGQITLDQPSGEALRAAASSSTSVTTAAAASAAASGVVATHLDRSSTPLSTTHDDTDYLDPAPARPMGSEPPPYPPPLLPAPPAAKWPSAAGSYPGSEIASPLSKAGGAGGGWGPPGGSAKRWAEAGGEEVDVGSDAGSDACRPPPVLLPLRPLPDWSFSSVGSGSLASTSTFTSRDDHAFRHGLASLDASIARLQHALTSRLRP
ncbi:coiled-coil domain-containing protein 14 [Lampetra fluviatilis]